MQTPKDILGHVSGGRVLDLATGRGGFIHFQIEGLQDYREIIGVDNNERYASEFTQAFNGQANIHFMLKGVDLSHINALTLYAG